MASATEFDWMPQPATWNWLKALVADSAANCEFVGGLQRQMLEKTGTRLIDWLDHIRVPESQRNELLELGYHTTAEDGVLRHSAGLFPPILLSRHATEHCLAIKVESVDSFRAHHHSIPPTHTLGDINARFCLAEFTLPDGNFIAVSRHGFAGFQPTQDDLASRDLRDVTHRLSRRSRELATPDAARSFAMSRETIREAIGELGQNAACSLFFQTEREYWQSMNRAAFTQYIRQEQLGLGWANHDHHTYRCSREWFAPLISVFEELGFHCRERFYAGEQAGWGAQVLEHPVCGIVIFADVDMTAEELSGDFAHVGLEARTELGTVGLWCKLHGESFLWAGMHHLECQFDFSAAREQLAALDIETMAPFTDFPYLKQAFTRGEHKQVLSYRIADLLTAGSITQAQADTFAAQGAIHSHLEILQRDDGYKGFNQTGVSDIIHKTDPRRQSK